MEKIPIPIVHGSPSNRGHEALIARYIDIETAYLEAQKPFIDSTTKNILQSNIKLCLKNHPAQDEKPFLKMFTHLLEGNFKAIYLAIIQKEHSFIKTIEDLKITDSDPRDAPGLKK